MDHFDSLKCIMLHKFKCIPVCSVNSLGILLAYTTKVLINKNNH